MEALVAELWRICNTLREGPDWREHEEVAERIDAVAKEMAGLIGTDFDTLNRKYTLI